MKHVMSEENISMFWDELIGSQLSSVEFVQDYLQIGFDGPCINVINPLTIKADGKEITSWQAGFRDLLCGQITKIVKDVNCDAGKRLTIRFTDDSQIDVSLLSEDYSSAEAFYAHGFKDYKPLVE